MRLWQVDYIQRKWYNKQQMRKCLYKEEKDWRNDLYGRK